MSREIRQPGPAWEGPANSPAGNTARLLVRPMGAIHYLASIHGAFSAARPVLPPLERRAVRLPLASVSWDQRGAGGSPRVARAPPQPRAAQPNRD